MHAKGMPCVILGLFGRHIGMHANFGGFHHYLVIIPCHCPLIINKLVPIKHFHVIGLLINTYHYMIRGCHVSFYD